MKSKRRPAKKITFFVIVILIFLATYAAFFGVSNYYGDTKKVYVKGTEDIRWGIDINGGVEAIFMPDVKTESITQADMDSAKEIIETRLVNLGITESEVRTDTKNKQVVVRFPWKPDESDFDPTTAIAELGETAVLKFCEGEDNTKVVLQGAAHIESASAQYSNESGYLVALKLTKDGASKFAEATARLKGQVISIWMDDQMISNPTVNEVITNGEAVITGNYDADSAKKLADQINAGSLPFALTVDNSKLQIISPTLGAKARDVMAIAGIAAFAAICVIMILMFRLPGLITSIALLGQVAGMIAASSGFFPGVNGVTLTIPGIAGIILSIGMGVDANVIASERIKEEFAKGKTIDGAIEAGFENSFNAVLDGNVTVFIVSAVLMGAFGTSDTIMGKIFSPIMQFFGSSVTGSVYSFGYTLLVGVIFNMIMGVYFSKAMLKSVSRFKFLRKPWLYGGAKDAK